MSLSPPAADRLAGLVLATLVLGSPPVPAATPEERGLEIARRSDATDRGFGDSVVTLEMVLRNQAGREARRSLTVHTLEVAEEGLGDRSLVLFESPPDVEGTGLLSHARILEPDDQWLYLPAVRRVKRISSVNRSGPFVGSEFAFEDFTAHELGKFSYRHLREERCGDLLCDVIERTPRYEHSGYSRQEAWIDRTDRQVRRVEFFDRRDALLKTLILSDYRRYPEGFWRAHRLSMQNHRSGKSTELLYSDYRFGRGLTEADFSRAALERLR
ncbi:MAG: outer membrane lipoprotein-sorting protein [Thermoanaerobaculia bacterium]|nr:outer membrane lipoprotein-sorting protein [Thermoanaerobaculia bacterium]